LSADFLLSIAKSSAVASTASVRSVKHKTIVKISDQIDRLVMTKLEEEGIKRNPLAQDEVFLRRIYLDVVGRIPTLPETQSFLNSKSKNKRQELIDDLLDSYGFVSHQFNFLADILRVRTRINKVVGQPYIDFIKDSLEENMPYDQFVVELLTAEGKMLSKESSAVGYYLRDLNMPEDNMSNTVRVFLGTRLECAQCHDHPFDKWTQRDYFEMVAFTGGIDYGPKTSGKKFWRCEKNPAKATFVFGVFCRQVRWASMDQERLWRVCPRASWDPTVKKTKSSSAKRCSKKSRWYPRKCRRP
jgi:hypothetical protein